MSYRWPVCDMKAKLAATITIQATHPEVLNDHSCFWPVSGSRVVRQEQQMSSTAMPRVVEPKTTNMTCDLTSAPRNEHTATKTPHAIDQSAVQIMFHGWRSRMVLIRGREPVVVIVQWC